MYFCVQAIDQVEAGLTGVTNNDFWNYQNTPKTCKMNV